MRLITDFDRLIYWSFEVIKSFIKSVTVFKYFLNIFKYILGCFHRQGLD